MTKLDETAAVVRSLVEYFSAHSPEAGEQLIAQLSVAGPESEAVLPLVTFKNDLMAQPAVARMVTRFQANPFDMENVFDLEDMLKKVVQQHTLFSGVVAETEVSEVEEAVKVGADPVPDFLRRGSNEQQSFVRYMRWANHVFYEACSGLTLDELSAQRHIPFDSMLSLLNHVYIMQLVWQAHLQGRPHGFTSRRPVEDIGFAKLRQQQLELDNWFVAYADKLPPAAYSERIDFEFIGGGAGVMSRSEMLQHVVTHASYHRGHICGVFYQLGYESPTTDLPVFLRLCNEQK